jgi:transposase
MGKFIKKKWFIGIDISKNFIDAAILNEKEPGRFISHRFQNDLKGFENMKEWYVTHEVKLSGTLFCMEHTGTYGLLLFAWLSQQKADFCVEPGLQIKRSQGMTRGKTDVIDARRIASYALNKRADLKQYVLPTEILVQIKQLLTYRDQLVRVRSGLKSSLQNHREYQQVTSYDFVTKNIQKQIENLDQSVIEVEKQIIAFIASEEKLQENFKLATSVKGVGLVIAAFMLVTTQNFTGFENGRKFACYAGIAPFPDESGTSIKGKSKVSHLGNIKMKTLLANGANSAKSWDPEIRAYYKRKIDEGKEHKSVINAISCKLVNRVFAVIKRQTPFVSIYQQNFA